MKWWEGEEEGPVELSQGDEGGGGGDADDEGAEVGMEGPVSGREGDEDQVQNEASNPSACNQPRKGASIEWQPMDAGAHSPSRNISCREMYLSKSPIAFIF